MTGSYEKWLINHLGLKDVLDYQITVNKLAKKLKYLKGDMVSHGYLIAIIDLEYIAKDVADKALATKILLQEE